MQTNRTLTHHSISFCVEVYLVYFFIFSVSTAYAQVGAKADAIMMPNAAGTPITFNRCVVTKIEPDGVKVSHDDGFAKIPYQFLPEAWKKAMPYDEGKAKDFMKQKERQTGNVVTEAQAAEKAKTLAVEIAKSQARKEAAIAEVRIAAAAKVLAAQEAEAAEARAAGIAPSELLHIRAKVIQVIRGGLLVDLLTDQGGALREPCTLFIACSPAQTRNVVDGQKIHSSVVSDGTYDYTTVLGANKRLRKYKLLKAVLPD